MKNIFITLIAIVILVSCKKEVDNQDEIYLNEVTTELNNLDADLGITYGAVKNDPAFVAISNLIEIFSKSSSANQSNSVAFALSAALQPTVKIDEKPSLPTPGTYTWNKSKFNWDISVGIPADAIVLIFPSEKSNGDVNNCTVTLKNADFGLFLGKQWMLKSLKVTVDINGVVVGTIDHTSTWPESSPIPYIIDSKIAFGPFDVLFHGNITVAKNYHVSSSVKLATKMLSSSDITLDLDMTSTQLPVTAVSGFFQYGSMKFDGSFDIKSIAIAKLLGKEINADVLNANIDIKLYHFASNTLMGQLYIKTIVDGEPVVYIKMVDGKDLPFLPLLLKNINLPKLG